MGIRTGSIGRRALRGRAAFAVLVLVFVGGAAAAGLGSTCIGCAHAPATIVPSTPAITTPGQLPTSVTSEPSTAPSTAGTGPSTTPTTIYTHAIPQPVRIVIPVIQVDATVIDVGILESGSMEVPPFGLAAWYSLGPAPGANGPAVIVGHVDSKSGPDVFYRLSELEPGDHILVYGDDGDTATFVVDDKEQALKSELPTERIWNDTKEPVIRLVTCGGDFDRSSGHYLSNVIVYGHLLE
jgi:hypothetical protein